MDSGSEVHRVGSKKEALDRAIEKAFDDGMKQIEKYTSDKRLIPMLTQGRDLKAGVLVFVGLKEVKYKAWEGSHRAT